MSTNYIHIGTLNDHSQDHSRHMTISVSGADVNSIVRAFFAEDVEEVEEDKASEKKGLFCRITKAAYEKGVAQQVEDEISSACVSAPKLVKALNTNDALGYTDTKNLTSSELFEMLDEHYGLSFKKHHFTICRGK